MLPGRANGAGGGGPAIRLTPSAGKVGGICVASVATEFLKGLLAMFEGPG